MLVEMGGHLGRRLGCLGGGRVTEGGGGPGEQVESCDASCPLHLEEGESWYPFKLSVCLSVRLSVCPSQQEGFQKKKQNRKKGGWVAVGITVTATVR